MEGKTKTNLVKMMADTRNDFHLEFALHLANHELAVEPLCSREHEQARRARGEEQARQGGEPACATQIGSALLTQRPKPE